MIEGGRDFGIPNHEGELQSSALERAPWFVAVLRGPDHTYEFTNDAYVKTFGGRGYVGGTLMKVFPELKSQGSLERLRRVMTTAESLTCRSVPTWVQPPGSAGARTVLDFRYTPLFAGNNRVTGVCVEGVEVTQAALASTEARALQFGPDTLQDDELLALLVQGNVPDDEAPDLARQLLDRFGGLRGVMMAATPKLMKHSPDPAVTLRVKVFREVGRRVLRQRLAERRLLSSNGLLKAYLRAVLSTEIREQFRVLFLDGSLRLIADELMERGTVSNVAVDTREVLRRALELAAKSMILVHNHPSGSQAISDYDKRITEDIVLAAGALDIEVHDHLIIAGDRVISFHDRGLMPSQTGTTRRFRPS